MTWLENSIELDNNETKSKNQKNEKHNKKKEKRGLQGVPRFFQRNAVRNRAAIEVKNAKINKKTTKKGKKQKTKPWTLKVALRPSGV